MVERTRVTTTQGENASFVPEVQQSNVLSRNCMERLCQKLQGG